MAEPIQRIEFTKEMKKDYTILIPNMLDIHFRFLVYVLRRNGYRVELLTNSDQDVRSQGIKYVHNDTCYPALLTIGQMISALKSGKYDLNKVALAMSQTGGGCRASNYIHLLRKALVNAGMGHIPVISVNLSGMEKNPGFSFTLPMLRQAFAALIFGDCLTLLNNQTKPYEINYGESENLVASWVKTICGLFEKGGAVDRKSIRSLLTQILRSFEKIQIADRKKVRVGIVGEIYVKYSPLANNNLEKFLFDQGCEVNVPGVLAFMLFKVDNRLEDIELYGGSGLKKIGVKVMFNYLQQFEEDLLSVLRTSERYIAPASYAHLKEIVAPYIGHGCKMGEGWLLTAEMLELIESGYENIVCAQPFGCLPNHIVGKGMIRAIRENHPEANIVAVDYDPGATQVNQENRIKLMLSIGREKLEERGKGIAPADEAIAFALTPVKAERQPNQRSD